MGGGGANYIYIFFINKFVYLFIHLRLLFDDFQHSNLVRMDEITSRDVYSQ